MATPMGERINAARKGKGLTLDQLAEKSGCSKSYIWELENKNPPRPSADKLSKIAVELGVTVEFLLDTAEAVSVEDATDSAFFRRYRKMDPQTKIKIQRMVDLLGENDT